MLRTSHLLPPQMIADELRASFFEFKGLLPVACVELKYVPFPRSLFPHCVFPSPKGTILNLSFWNS